MLYTHYKVDLDAVASLWAWTRFVLMRFNNRTRFKFVPADWDGEEMKKNDVALDIYAGGKGIKGKRVEEVMHSCFAILIERYCTYEEKYALKDIAAYVDAQDSTGNGARTLGAPDKAAKVWQRIGPVGILEGLRIDYEGNDLKICRDMFKYLDGILKTGLHRSKVWSLVNQAEWFDNKVVLAINLPREATKILFRKGANIIVFAQGNNLGVLRKNGLRIQLNHPIILDLIEKEVAEWVLQPSGYLFSRGTEKASKATPSVVKPETLSKAYSLILEP